MRTRFPMEKGPLVAALKAENLLGPGIVPESFNLNQYNSLLGRHQGKVLVPVKDGRGLTLQRWGKEMWASFISDRNRDGRFRVVASTMTSNEERKLRKAVGR